jgi:hypothetical protein
MVFLLHIEAVQQSKIGIKRKVNTALNPKTIKIFSTKSNCGIAVNDGVKIPSFGRLIPFPVEL